MVSIENLGELANIDPCQASKNKSIEQLETESSTKSRSMVGLPGFEPESIEPKSTSLDQASRQPQIVAEKDNF